MKKAFVFCNNNYKNFQFTTSRLSGNFVIAADGGANFLDKNGIHIDALIGDNDSVSQTVLNSLPSETEILKFPTQKDKSDTELAIEFCVAKGFEEVEIVNAVNGQIDHSLANVFIIEKFIHTLKFSFLNKSNRMYFIKKDFTIQDQKKRKISLLPLTDSVMVKSTKGLEYSLTNEKLFRSSSKGISNYNTESRISITVDSGILLCIIER